MSAQSMVLENGVELYQFVKVRFQYEISSWLDVSSQNDKKILFRSLKCQFSIIYAQL